MSVENLSASGEIVVNSEGTLVKRMSTDDFDNAVAKVNSLNSTKEMGMFSTYDLTTFTGKVNTMQAITDSTPASDYLGEPFTLKGVVVHAITMSNNVEGELIEQPGLRVILVTEELGNIHSVSVGIFNSVKNIIGALGLPSEWDEDLKCKVVEERSRTSGFRFMTIKLEGM